MPHPLSPLATSRLSPSQESPKSLALRVAADAFSLLSPPIALVALLGLLAAEAVGATTATPHEISAENRDFFENNIRPILAAHCLECHSAAKGKTKGGLNLDTRQDTLRGGENGAIIVPGDIAGSALIKAVEWAGDLQMPPKKKLSADQIAALKNWVQRGAPDPREGATGIGMAKHEHWSFQPVTRPNPPAVKNEVWVKNSIDRFVLAKLEEKDLFPAELPDTGSSESRFRKKAALLRRAYFDLVGFPPSPAEISHFAADSSPDAFAKVIDRLLDSSAYGERWARHWMDTARYGDTSGSKKANLAGKDYRYPYAWTYRDWLIRAINEDMPYDQFIIHQLAADRIPGNNPNNLAALGFLTVGEGFQFKDDVINDQIDVVGRGLMGLTLSCARCHDHKFDPIKMSDYYALKGVFQSVEEPKEGPLIGGADPHSKEFREFAEKKASLEQRIYARVNEMQRQLSDQFRKRSGTYFQLAYLHRLETDKSDADAARKGQAMAEAAKLKTPELRMIPFHIGVHISKQDPILGPFLNLIHVEGKPDDLTSSLPTKIMGYQKSLVKQLSAEQANPIVVDFLSRAGKLPSDLSSVSALLERFFRERVEPLVKDGIFDRLASDKPLSEADKAKAQLACFPLQPVGGFQLDVEKVRELCFIWGEQDGGQLQHTSGLNNLNDLKMSSGVGEVRAMVVVDKDKPVDSPIFPRGNPPKGPFERKTVPRRFIEVLAPEGKPEPFKEGSGRLELAKAIASRDNPLTARVIVNRVWMYHFGEGLVRTPDDLGNQAGTPSHPELLDFLSSWFMDDFGPAKPGWSMKSLHKAMMLSSTYQQSSRTPYLDRQKEIDPQNTFLWRTNVRRLDFEAFRDSLLAMSGRMDTELYGPPINLLTEPYSLRRSIYGYIDRGDVPDILNHFDFANPNQPNTKRTATIVPQQALFLLNSPFTLGVVQSISRREDLKAAVMRDTRAGISMVFQIVLQRSPSSEELALAHDFLLLEARRQNKELAETRNTVAEAQKLAEAQLKSARAAKTDGHDARQEIINEGELVARQTLSPWEALIQALMFSNEAAYLD